ncbi:unnamed protein product, partial [Staurois parvus]
ASQCHISVPISDAYQCPSVPPSNSNQCHLSVPCTSMPHISAHLSCFSVLPVSATYQCLSVPVSAAYQYHLPVPLVSAIYECCLSVPIRD